ncbi:hypothetical protein QYE76_067922 [Lolium multiflorum]|uniref:Uncharacterized protein n=1 Tax=Lolium multiflorum TaxID=4521 RepID=A0AAD8WDF7_LOLMU|nr:hypothetical protein QYE76_067922 [Lolium multiflorum]
MAGSSALCAKDGGACTVDGDCARGRHIVEQVACTGHRTASRFFGPLEFAGARFRSMDEGDGPSWTRPPPVTHPVTGTPAAQNAPPFRAQTGQSVGQLTLEEGAGSRTRPSSPPRPRRCRDDHVLAERSVAVKEHGLRLLLLKESGLRDRLEFEELLRCPHPLLLGGGLLLPQITRPAPHPPLLALQRSSPAVRSGAFFVGGPGSTTTGASSSGAASTAGAATAAGSASSRMVAVVVAAAGRFVGHL